MLFRKWKTTNKGKFIYYILKKKLEILCVVISGRKIYRLRKIFAIVDRVIVSVDYTNIRNDGAYHVLDYYHYKNKKITCNYWWMIQTQNLWIITYGFDSYDYFDILKIKLDIIIELA